MKTIFITLISVLLCWEVFAQCSAVKNIVEQIENKRIVDYKTIDAEGGAVKRKSRTIFLQQASATEAVLILHGFAASPAEVKSVVKAVTKAGFTVYAPLIFGFGSSALVANSYKSEQWSAQVKESFDLLASCYSKVHIIGFSLGSSLAANFVLSESHNISGKLVLISPYFSLGQAAGNLAVTWISKAIASVGISTLYKVSSHPDLKMMISFPEEYNTEMPLSAASQVISFGSKVLDDHKEKQALDNAVMMVYSEADKTIDMDVAYRFVSDRFTKVEIMKYTANFGIPHQVTREEGNKYLGKLQKAVVDFLNK